ncbi:hypothetical protein [Salegentibacter sp. T436]|uniref:hypothetical protein n=1 Tax=Salegentibacter sp. T436 TaxID=1729720 RepID=UPI00094A1D62|nr:hypothetical protein [Salegentibacter sp. T436]APS40613.1 hypothetical protein AO058_17790 [Salegentibacter sp. T436]
MKNLTEFEGIKFIRSDTSDHIELNDFSILLESSIDLAEKINLSFNADKNSLLSSSLNASLLTANTLINSNFAKCTIEHPPEDIEYKNDSLGNIVLRCFHSPSHEWDLNGNLK